MNLLSALLAGPGPANGREALLLFLKGFGMGVADIIPGVSGGTIAFITGIYEDLLAAIKSVGPRCLQKLFSLDLTGAIAEAHTRFLLPLLIGIASAILLAAHAINYLLVHYPVPVWSLFFGLITASVAAVAGHLGRFGVVQALLLLAGGVCAYFIVDMIPVQTPETLWFVFLSGVIAICAMILPGISGAFLLLILGKYEFVTQAVRNPLQSGNLIILLVFGLGCALGIAGFSRLLHFLLRRYHDATVAVLTGVMLGALRKVWPWKVVLEERVIAGKSLVVKTANVLPGKVDEDVLLALLLMAVGFIAVMLLERRGASKRMSRTQA